MSADKIQSELKDRLYEGMSEPLVRLWIIDPYIKEVLNWNVVNTYPEYSVHSWNGKDADYALSSNSEPKILVEAKALDVNIKKERGQLFEYLDLVDVNYGMITNGRDFEIIERKGNDNHEVIHKFKLGDKVPELLKCDIDSNQIHNKGYDNTEQFSKILCDNAPQFVNNNIIDILTIQYHSGRTQIDPVHIGLFVDESTSRKVREFLFETYDNILYGKSYKKKDFKITCNSRNPSVIVYDNINSDYTINKLTLRNAFDSIIFDESTGMPKDTSILILDSPKEGRWNKFDPVVSQLNINSDLISDIDLINVIENPDVNSDNFDKIINEEIDSGNIADINTSFKVTDSIDIDINNIKSNSKSKDNMRSKLKDMYKSISSINKPIGINKITTFNKITKIIAHLDGSNKINKKHLDISIDIIIKSLKQIGYYEETGTFNPDMTESNQSSSQRDRRNKLRQVIAENEDEGEKGAPKELIIDIMKEESEFEEDEVEYDLYKLGREGDKIYEPYPKEFANI